MDTIKVVELFRVIGDNGIPINDIVDDIIPEFRLKRFLERTRGTKVLNLRTGRVVLRFDKKTWSWNPVDEEFLSD